MVAEQNIAVIGFGEAGQTFAKAGQWGAWVRVYDRLTDTADTAQSQTDLYKTLGVTGALSHAEAVAGASTILSLVTADQALEVARTTAQTLQSGALYLDLNSVSPVTKREAAAVIEAAGGHYVDVAVMAPVQPAALSVPLNLSGDQSSEAASRLTALGFTKVRVLDGGVGQASAIKMIRSVMIKGMEALTAECVMAARRADVLDEVLASLEASWSGANWQGRADYNLDRMLVHGGRRSAEMAEVVRTLDELGTGSAMSRGTVARQAELGALGLKSPPEGLEDKLTSILTQRANSQ